MGCSVPLCKSRSEKRVKGLSFHSFPSDPEIKDLWVKTINRVNWTPSKYSRICSVHFEPSCFVVGKTKNFLIDSAVPSILPCLKQISGTKKKQTTIHPVDESDISENPTKNDAPDPTDNGEFPLEEELSEGEINPSDNNHKSEMSLSALCYAKEKQISLLKSKLKNANRIGELRSSKLRCLRSQLKRVIKKNNRMLKIISFLMRKGTEEDGEDHSLEATDVVNIANTVLRQNAADKTGVFLVVVRKNCS